MSYFRSAHKSLPLYISHLESVEFIRRTLPPQIPLMEDPLIPMINVIVNAADARKATSISAFRISSVTEITTFMVIVEGE